MDELKAQILKKMSKRNYYGHKLINFSDLLRFVSSDLRGDAKRCINELYKEGFLNKRPDAQGEFRYSLCIEKADEISRIIGDAKTTNYTFSVQKRYI